MDCSSFRQRGVMMPIAERVRTPANDVSSRYELLKTFSLACVVWTMLGTLCILDFANRYRKSFAKKHS